MALNVTEFDVTQLVEEVVEAVKGRAIKNKNVIDFFCEPKVGRMVSDREKVKRNLICLMNKSCKTIKNGNITLRAGKKVVDGKLWVIFKLEDNFNWGKSRMFKDILADENKSKEEIVSDYGKMGLGLDLLKRATIKVGGHVEAEDMPDRGTKITINLPQNIRPASETFSDLFKSKKTQWKGHVLVIDDDPDLLDMVGEILSGDGYRVYLAKDADHGLSLIENNVPDVIILDIIMPHKDGWSVLSKLKHDSRLRTIPVIMMTIKPDRELGLNQGASEYLMKPVSAKKLLEAVNRFCLVKVSPQVFIFDEDESYRKMNKKMLEEEGFTVDDTGRLDDAINRLKKTEPNVLMTDLSLTGINGFEFIDMVKSDDHLKNTKVFVVTDKELSHMDSLRLKNKVEKVFLKGLFSSDQLIEAVDEVIPIGE